ncbi:MAG: VWA domain-containing protein [Acidobacteria bacterium]|nr:VWA domain-containing protein [Acidobacteriota bacterium]MCA1641622.1 VWA domain-containing protein [Acidobacteriota bacterium]
MKRNRITRTRTTPAPLHVFHAPLCAFALCLALAPAAAPIARQQASQIRTARAQGTPQPSPPQPTPQAQPTQAQPADQPGAQPAVKLGFHVVDGANHAVADVRREDVSLTVDGAPQTITYFAREESPVSYGLVIDNSGSVRQILDLLARTAGTLVAANRPEDEAFVMRFVDQRRTNILEDFTSDKQSLASALSDMYVEGGQTAVIDAIYRAAEHTAGHAGANRRLALVVITDGEDRGSTHKLEELTQLLRREGVRVFVIGLTGLLDKTGGFIQKSSREKASELLETIAHESGGRAFFPTFGKTVGADLTLALNEIGESLRSQYVVGFTPSSAGADEKFHRVQIRISEGSGKEKRKVVAPPGYFAVASRVQDKE